MQDSVPNLCLSLIEVGTDVIVDVPYGALGICVIASVASASDRHRVYDLREMEDFEIGYNYWCS